MSTTITIKKKPRNPSLPLHRCRACGGRNCGYWYVTKGRDCDDGEIYLPGLGLSAPPEADTGRVVGTKLRPKGRAFAVHQDGTVDRITSSPCPPWKRYIARQYRNGVRFIHVEFDDK